jgi:formate dehydrogenase iron-sulfur subunit
MEADEAGAIVRDDETGAVIFKPGVPVKNFQDIRDACPYDIPRVDPETKVMMKCTMCLDRVKADMLPACVKTCPTGAMNFGDRAAMLRLADDRLRVAKKKFPGARLIDVEEVRAIYLLTSPASDYGLAMTRRRSPVMAAVGKLLGPFGALTAGAAVVGMFLGRGDRKEE